MLYWVCDTILDHWRLLFGLFILQGIFGVILFEWAWKQAARQRDGEKELNDQFPSYKRLDIHKWSRWQFYPWNFLFCVPRCIALICTALSIGFVMNILLFG